MAFQVTQINEEDIEPLAAQVGGHIFAEDKIPCMLKHKDGYVLKLVRKSQQSKQEMEFYKTLPSAPYAELQQFIPKFYGTSKININGFCADVIVLQNLVGELLKPCVMDIKIGKQTWDPFAQPQKIEAEKKKYSECKRDLSFCIPGFQVYVPGNDLPLKFGKEYGKNLNKETVPKAFLTFLNFKHSETAAKRIIQHYIIQLEKILNIFLCQTSLHVYSSSILLTYDSAKYHTMEPVSSWANVHMIDFAHAFSSIALVKGRDENYLEGLKSLLTLLHRLEHQGDCTEKGKSCT